MNDVHDNALDDKAILETCRQRHPELFNAAAGPFPAGYGNPAIHDMPIDLTPTVRDWGEASQEATRITRVLMGQMDCTHPSKFERAMRRILTYYLVTGELPHPDAIRTAGDLVPGEQP